MLSVHNEATADLRALLGTDRGAVIKLLAFFEQLRADPRLVDMLLVQDYGSDRRDLVGVKKWDSVQFRVERLPVWRMRAWDLERQGVNYRVFYLWDWKQRSFNILAIVPRAGFNYDDPTHPIRQRIVRCIRRDFPGI